MTWILHIAAALLWAIFAIMCTGFGAKSKSDPDEINVLMPIMIILVGVVAFTIQVIA